MGRRLNRPNRLITWGQVYPGHPSLETASASTRSHQGNPATVPDHSDVAQGGIHVDADEDVERMSDNDQDPTSLPENDAISVVTGPLEHLVDIVCQPVFLFACWS
jgi:hypothetical protein